MLRLLRDEQLEVVQRAIVALGTRPDTVNLVVRIALDGGLKVEEIPAPTPHLDQASR